MHTTSNPFSDDVREAIENLDRARARVSEVQRHVEELRAGRRARLVAAWQSLKRAIFREPVEPIPPSTNPATGNYVSVVRAVVDCGPIITAGDPYDRWLELHSVREPEAARLRDLARHVPNGPTFSILMPTFRTPSAFLRAAIDSVRGQVYPKWELCIVDDGSDLAELTDVLRSYAALDDRIRVSFATENRGISAATNAALEMATGEYIALLDHDDVLTPHALLANALALSDDPSIDMLYSDEDKIDSSGHRFGPYFKPQWSPDTMLSKMYTCHFGVYRRSIATQIGGFRTAFDGAQDWDFVLRFTERSARIHHIPDVLYSWRLSETSAAQSEDAKPYAYVAARLAIAEALERRGERGRVLPLEGHAAGTFYVRYDLVAEPLVSIIVPTRDRADLLGPCVVSILQRSTYANVEIIVVDNGSVEPQTKALFDEFTKRYPKVRIIEHPAPFNYSELNNIAVRQARGDVLVFLNNDTEILSADWIEAMLEQAQRPAIGAVGGLLFYADGSIQHSGIVLGIGGIAGHAHRHFPGTSGGYVNAVVSPTNYSAVTGAALMVRRSVFEEVGGFDEAFSVAYNDVDLCLRIRSAGYVNIYVPGARIIHYESKTRGYDSTPGQLAINARERALMIDRWGDALGTDPYYSPHLTQKLENFAMRIVDTAL